MDTSFTYVVGSAPLDQQLEFPALAVTVDNPTNQWIRLDSLGVVVPQYTLGATYPLPRTTRAQASFTAPAGQAEPPIIVAQAATITFNSLALPLSAGVGMLGGRAPYYDRNPMDVAKNAGQTLNANSGTTTLWTYTVPVGRRAYLEAGFCFTQISTVYANDFADLSTAITINPMGALAPGTIPPAVQAQIFGGLVVYTTAVSLLGASIEIQATDVVAALALDARAAGAGAAFHLSSAKLTEFDA